MCECVTGGRRRRGRLIEIVKVALCSDHHLGVEGESERHPEELSVERKLKRSLGEGKKAHALYSIIVNPPWATLRTGNNGLKDDSYPCSGTWIQYICFTALTSFGISLQGKKTSKKKRQFPDSSKRATAAGGHFSYLGMKKADILRNSLFNKAKRQGGGTTEGSGWWERGGK